MKRKIICSNVVLCIIFIIVAIANLLIEPKWDYDSFAPAITVLELNNLNFKNYYFSFFSFLALPDQFIEIVVSAIIIPLRWTYALGISPLLNFIRIGNLDWYFERIILLIPYIVLAFLGFKLILNELQNRLILLLLIILILSSHEFFYWIFTFTSYSYHLFCFGLILYANNENNNKFIGFINERSFFNSLVLIFNYQYIPFIIFLFINNIFSCRSRDVTLLLRRSKVFCLPLFTIILTCIFLYLRAALTGKHSSPTYAALPVDMAIQYNFLSHISNPLDAITFLFESYVNIMGYFFDIPYIGFILGNFILFSSIFSFFIKVKKYNNIYLNCLLLILSIVLLHLSGVMPLTSSRHQLILFLPICLLSSIAIYKIFSQFLKFNISISFLYLILIFCIYLQLNYSFNNRNRLSFEELNSFLKYNNINQLLLAPCSLMPILDPNIRNLYQPIYRCGPNVFERISSSTNRLAIWSSSEMSLSQIEKYLSEFSNDNWGIDYNFQKQPSLNSKYSQGYIYLAIKK